MPPKETTKLVDGELYYYDEVSDKWVPMRIRLLNLETQEEVEYEVTDKVLY